MSKITQAEVDELNRPPTETEVERALADFVETVKLHYGSRLLGLYLFGSRARGDYEPDSDADVAVVLADDGWQFWDEKMQLSDLSFPAIVDWGVYVQAWPVTITTWKNPEGYRNPSLVRAMQRDGKAIYNVAA
jgi:antitoxin ChpS